MVHPLQHLIDAENVQLGLNFQKHPTLHAQISKRVKYLTSWLGRQTWSNSRIVERGDSEIYSLIEVIVEHKPKNEVYLEIEFWPDGQIVVCNHSFKEGYELNLTFPTASIPVEAGEEYGNVDDLVEWLRAFNNVQTPHRFISAKTLLEGLTNYL